MHGLRNCNVQAEDVCPRWPFKCKHKCRSSGFKLRAVFKVHFEPQTRHIKLLEDSKLLGR